MVVNEATTNSTTICVIPNVFQVNRISELLHSVLAYLISSHSLLRGVSAMFIAAPDVLTFEMTGTGFSQADALSVIKLTVSRC